MVHISMPQENGEFFSLIEVATLDAILMPHQARQRVGLLREMLYVVAQIYGCFVPSPPFDNI